MPHTAWRQQNLPQVLDAPSFPPGWASGSGQSFDSWPGDAHGAEGCPQQSQGMQVTEKTFDATELQDARRLAALPKPADGDVPQLVASTAMAEVQSKVWSRIEMLSAGVKILQA